jgi:hypothetical protein
VPLFFFSFAHARFRSGVPDLIRTLTGIYEHPLGCLILDIVRCSLKSAFVGNIARTRFNPVGTNKSNE